MVAPLRKAVERSARRWIGSDHGLERRSHTPIVWEELSLSTLVSISTRSNSWANSFHRRSSTLCGRHFDDASKRLSIGRNGEHQRPTYSARRFCRRAWSFV